ncbi:hypothetical protein MNV49_005948 [Pseudohyphozyma bogoriensis]|nr:hypothetical protein MNV49_005948 [Pseudohyphozyma bogoriensis]
MLDIWSHLCFASLHIIQGSVVKLLVISHSPALHRYEAYGLYLRNHADDIKVLFRFIEAVTENLPNLDELQHGRPGRRIPLGEDDFHEVQPMSALDCQEALDDSLFILEMCLAALPAIPPSLSSTRASPAPQVVGLQRKLEELLSFNSPKSSNSLRVKLERGRINARQILIYMDGRATPDQLRARLATLGGSTELKGLWYFCQLPECFKADKLSRCSKSDIAP